jgi:hypothetical protein
MLEGIYFDVKKGSETKTFYIPDDSLLTVVETQMKNAKDNLGLSGGIPLSKRFDQDKHQKVDDSYHTCSPGRFISAWKGLNGKNKYYFTIGGQMVEKIKPPETEKGTYYMTIYDNDKTSTDRYPFGDTGLSYPGFLKELDKIKIKTNDLDTSKKLAKIMRDFMINQNSPDPSLANLRENVVIKRWIANLAAVIFIAEPKRNNRCYPINLMLLDLIEKGITYGSNKNYTWQNVLWHPEADPRNSAPPSKPQFGEPVFVETNGKKKIIKIKRIETRKDLDKAGGKLPAAMTGSGSTDVAKEIAPEKYYTQQKEVTVLVRWLCENKELKQYNFKSYKRERAKVTIPDAIESKSANQEFRNLPANAELFSKRNKNFASLVDGIVYKIKTAVDERIKNLDLKL